MRNTRSVWFLLSGIASVLFMSGCWVGSLHPYYTKYSDLKGARDLIGHWELQSGDCGGRTNAHQPRCTLAIAANEGSSALRAVVHDEAGQNTHLTVQEFDVEGVRFLDASLVAPDDENEKALLYSQHLITTHSLWRIEVSADALMVSRIDEDYLKDLLESQGTEPEMPFVVVDDGSWGESLLLTATPAALKGFVARHARDSMLFSTGPDAGAEQLVFTRKRPIEEQRMHFTARAQAVPARCRLPVAQNGAPSASFATQSCSTRAH